MFGGHSFSMQLAAEFLPAGWVALVCAGVTDAAAVLPANFLRAAVDSYLPDYVNAADCVIGKIGYGSVSECLAHRCPLIFVRRDFFNEEPFLRKLLEVHQCGVEMKRRCGRLDKLLSAPVSHKTRRYWYKGLVL